jgi:hypothetical protein
MSRFSTTLDVSKELKGFEDNSGDEIEEEAEASNSERESKPKKGRNYAEEFEVYEREEEMDEEMDELDSEINGKSEAKTVSEDTPEKIVIKSYNVKKKQKAEFVDVDEVAEPKNKDDADSDDEGDDDDSDDDSGDEERGTPRKVNGGNGKKDNGDEHASKSSWLWAAILIILIIGAGAAGYILFKNARQHAAETNLSGFPEQIAKDNEVLGQNLSMNFAGELDNALEVEPAAGENGTEQAETVAEENASNETVLIEERNESALKDVLIQGLY